MSRFITSALLLTASLFVHSVASIPADHVVGVHAPVAEDALPLRATKKIAIPTETNRPLYRPARCDGNGNIYFRAYQLDDRKIPIIRVDGRGATLKYTFDSDADLAKGASYDFSVLPDGHLYQPVQVGQDVYIVAYDQDAKIRWKTKLQTQFWISHLIAISDESFLVNGVEIQAHDSVVRQPPRLFTAIVDNKGNIVRRFSIEKDTAVFRQAKRGDNKGDETKEPIVLPVLEGDAQTGEDGEIYWMLRSEPPMVDVLDSAGKLTQFFEIDPPGVHMTPVSMSLSKGQLAIFFRGSFRGMSTGMHGMAGTDHLKGIVTVTDTSSGNVIANFAVGSNLSETMACYQGKDFAFVIPDQKNLAVQHAVVPESNLQESTSSP